MWPSSTRQPTRSGSWCACAAKTRACGVFARRQRVFVSAEEGGAVDVIDFAKREQVAQVLVGDRPRGIGFSPDGRTAYVAAENASEVY